MEVKYYNSEKFKLTIRQINGDILQIARELFYSPQINFIIGSDKDFDTYKWLINSDDMIECDKETFDSRVDEVAKLTKEYING